MNVVYVYAVPGERWSLIRGPVGRWLRSAGIPALRTPMHGGWWLFHERVPDVIAQLEATGFHVTFRQHRAPRYMPPTPRTEAA